MKDIRIFKSIRNKLFASLCIIVLLIISILILLNNFVLGKYYLYNKKNNLKIAYNVINEMYNNSENSEDMIEAELDRISIKNDFDILIKDEYNQSTYISSKDFFSGLIQMNMLTSKNNFDKDNILEKNEKYTISEIKDDNINIKYIIFIYNSGICYYLWRNRFIYRFD